MHGRNNLSLTAYDLPLSTSAFCTSNLLLLGLPGPWQKACLARDLFETKIKASAFHRSTWPTENGLRLLCAFGGTTACSHWRLFCLLHHAVVIQLLTFKLLQTSFRHEPGVSHSSVSCQALWRAPFLRHSTYWSHHGSDFCSSARIWPEG